jgi:uncharacterized membrane protein YtjA (UPF0391 family)
LRNLFTGRIRVQALQQEQFSRLRIGFQGAAWPRIDPRDEECLVMLGWALTFLVVALIAAVLGFGGIAGLSVEIAKIIFFVAILLFAISAIVGLVRGRSPTLP